MSPILTMAALLKRLAFTLLTAPEQDIYSASSAIARKDLLKSGQYPIA
jgi:hypothetical protein